MNPSTSPEFRRQIYHLLIVVTIAVVCGRICGAGRVYEPWISRAEPGQSDFIEDDPRGKWPTKRPEPMPSMGANDRSRWATVRALVDEGAYSIGQRESFPVGAASIVGGLGAAGGVGPTLPLALAGVPKNYRDTGFAVAEESASWGTIDKVLDPKTGKFYSSKPPLLPTLVAGEYWLLKNTFGWSITRDRWLVMRTILLTINALPFAVYLVVLSRLVERLGGADWTRLLIVAAACFGTFLTTFATTFNNHTIAACTTLFALAAAWPVLAGAPALLPGKASGGWKPAEKNEREAETIPTEPTPATPPESEPPTPPVPVDIPRWRFALAGFFASLTAAFELPAACLPAGLFALMLLRQPRKTLRFAAPAALLPVAAFFATNYAAIGQLTPAYGEFGGPWYEYEGSYWKPDPSKSKRGIDNAAKNETRGDYAFHFLIGHHGLVSLTPFWLLSVVGVAFGLRHWRGDPGATRADGRPGFFALALLTAFVSTAVLGFFLLVTTTANYGGMTSGLRWLFWMTPLWLLVALPAADRLARYTAGRGLGLALLGASVFSAAYPALIPWRQPWLYQLLDYLGWVPY
jgi:hypothetical protein